jgi:hypothetical protein
MLFLGQDKKKKKHHSEWRRCGLPGDIKKKKTPLGFKLKTHQ